MQNSLFAEAPEPVPDERAVVRVESGAKELRLYDYQVAAAEAVREKIRSGVKNVVLCAATGSGKTVLAAYLMQAAAAKGKRALMIVDRTVLISQTSALLDDYGIEHGIIQANHWRKRPSELIQVASAQTLMRRTWPEDINLIVVDEAHCFHASVLARVDRRECVTIGLTATPFTRGMGKHYDAVVNVRTTRSLIKDGWLADFDVFAPSAPDMTGAKTVGGEWTDSEASARSIPIVGSVVQEYLARASGRKFIAFGADVAHAEQIQRQMEGAGIRCALYTYHTPDTTRTELVREFKDRGSSLMGLVSVAALARGFDVEHVSCGILARPLRKSLAEIIQQMGRILRRDPQDQAKRAILLDHGTNLERHWSAINTFFDEGPPPLDDGKKRKASQKKQEKKFRKCPKCSAVHSPRPTCPSCGHQYPRREKVHVAGDLKRLTWDGKDESVSAGVDRQSWYSQLIAIGIERDYKPGWAANKFRDRFGSWPDGLAKVVAEPSEEVRRWVQYSFIRWAKSKKKRENMSTALKVAAGDESMPDENSPPWSTSKAEP